jgi:hypothetical protein
MFAHFVASTLPGVLSAFTTVLLPRTRRSSRPSPPFFIKSPARYLSLCSARESTLTTFGLVTRVNESLGLGQERRLQWSRRCCRHS